MEYMPYTNNIKDVMYKIRQGDTSHLPRAAAFSGVKRSPRWRTADRDWSICLLSSHTWLRGGGGAGATPPSLSPPLREGGGGAGVTPTSLSTPTKCYRHAPYIFGTGMRSYVPTNQYNIYIWCTYIATYTGHALVHVCVCVCVCVHVWVCGCGCGCVCVYLKSFLPWVCEV